MSEGLEIRGPLLDYRLIKFAENIPFKSKIKFGVNKIQLRQLLKNKFPSTLISKKQPFFVPIADWLRNDFMRCAKI